MTNLEQDNRVGQVQVIPLRRGAHAELEVLVLKRNEAKGGFWQPVTGGIEPGEAVQEAACRELNEELGVTANDCLEVINDEYTFEFTDMHRGVQKTFTEHVLAVILRSDFEITLSDEHVDSIWTNKVGALALLKYDSNKTSLLHYMERIES